MEADSLIVTSHGRGAIRRTLPGKTGKETPRLQVVPFGNVAGASLRHAGQNVVVQRLVVGSVK